MNPRILMILPRIPIPARDGAEVVMLETLQAIRQSGQSVDVFALNPSRQHRDPSLLALVCKTFATANVSTNVSPLHLIASVVAAPSVGIMDQKVPLSYWITRFIDAEALNTLHDFVKQHGPYDVVHCETLFSVYYGLALEHGTARTIVYRSHNVEWRIQDRLAHEPSTPLYQRMIRQVLAKQTRSYECWISNHVDAIAAISAHDAAWHHQLGTHAIVRELHPGISIQSIPKVGEVEYAIGFLGSLDWEPNRKGLVWFLEQVLPLIEEQIPEVRFTIAGRGSEEFCSTLRLPSTATCLGEVDSVSQFYASQTIAVAPLLSGSGIRIKLLEAFALFTPVITTSQGAEGLNVRHGSECMIEDDPRSFAGACIEMLRDKGMRHRCAHAAHAFVEQGYSHRAAATALVDLYRECLERL